MAEGGQGSDPVIQEACVQGVSSRSLDELVQAADMEEIPKNQVSRLCGEFDGKVRTLANRPLEGNWLDVWLDAIVVKVRQSGRIVYVAVTVAIGVNDDGA
jgi:putative transposase